MKLIWSKILVYLLNISIGYFVVSVVIAVILNPDYQFFLQFLSILGTGSLGWIFNIPLMTLGIATTLYYPLFFLAFTRRYGNSLLFTIGILLAVLTSILLFFIGLFSVEGETAYIHNLLALAYFMIVMVQMAILSLSYHPFITDFSAVPLDDIDTLNSMRWIGYLVSLLILLGLFGPPLLAFTLQKIIVALILIYLLLSTRIVGTIM